MLDVDADERIGPELAAEIRAVAQNSAADWHLIPVDNYVGERLVRWGWGASFGRSAHAGLYRRGAKTWSDDRVLHASVNLSGVQGPRLEARLRTSTQHYMLRRPTLHTSLRAGSAAQRRHQQLGVTRGAS